MPRHNTPDLRIVRTSPSAAPIGTAHEGRANKAPQPSRPISARETEYLRDYMEPVRNAAELAQRRHLYMPPTELRNMTRDYAAPYQFVPSEVAAPTFGERLVLFMRLNGEALSFWFAIVAIGLALAVVGGACMGMVL